MEPNYNHDSSPGSELPQLENATGTDQGEQQHITTPEVVSQRPPASVGSPALPVSSTAVSAAASDPAMPASNSTTSNSNTGLTADDTDLIEKEWVLKAKAIVMYTKNDPHAQNLQMSGVKADYLKKRYNKDLKVSET